MPSQPAQLAKVLRRYAGGSLREPSETITHTVGQRIPGYRKLDQIMTCPAMRFAYTNSQFRAVGKVTLSRRAATNDCQAERRGS
jgi:hypothetical protein